jgi:hypothetical protein
MVERGKDLRITKQLTFNSSPFLMERVVIAGGVAGKLEDLSMYPEIDRGLERGGSAWVGGWEGGQALEAQTDALRDQQPPPFSVVAPDFYFNEASTSKRFAWQTLAQDTKKLVQSLTRKTNERPSLKEYITINRA